MATTGKTAILMLEKAMETHEHQMDMLSLTAFEEPKGGEMEISENWIWRPYQQHAPLISGWDLTSSETDIIEETYPAVLGTPSNDFVEQRADKMRTQIFWERRAKESGRKQASALNQAIASAIAKQGSLFVRSNATSGYPFIAEAQALMNERQLPDNGRIFMLNDRDNLLFATDLAGRQTLQGRPENEAWAKGQIGANVAGFDVYTASFLINLVGGANPGTQVKADVSHKPEAGSVSATGVVTNVDARTGTISVTASASYNIGDKVTFRNPNPGTKVKALGLSDKTNTNQPMTFAIVAKPTATSVTVYPKPIAADDSALTTLQAAYANIDTQILAGARMVRENIDASEKTSIFWDREAVEVLGGTIPAELLKAYDGMKVISSTMKNGLRMYMVFDGDIAKMTFRFRLFTWYGITICNPSNCGAAVRHGGAAPTTLAPTTLATTLTTTVIP